MALINNKYFQCKFWKRLPNQATETVEEPIYFRAELISDKDKTLSSKFQNFFSPDVRIVLRTDSKLIFDSYEGEIVKGYVEFQGDIFQIKSISYDLVNHAGIGGNRFSKKHTEKNAIKVLVLI